VTHSNPDSLALSRQVLRLLIKLNLLVGALILALLVASLLNESWVMRALGVRTATLIVSARLIMIVGICATPLVHIVLTRLLTIVETVRAGDPFILANAARLKSIAWAILTLDLIHVTTGIVANAISPDVAQMHIDWGFSLTRWLAVLMLFVLARVFEQGASMREELEGTI
jgi:hypothetical protein